MNQPTQRDADRFRRRIRQGIATTLVLLTYLPAMSRAVAQTGKLSSETQAKIESAISRFMEDSKAPGISAAVVQGGEFVWSAGFGMADLENSVPATSQTLYRLGSISKPITATAAMALWEHDKLDLDSPVQKYCPAFPQKPWPITTRELLGHLGGIRYYNVPELPLLKRSIRRRGECGISGFRLQGARRGLAFLRTGHGAIRGGDPQ
jgi:CubicO group peptidase (beta-lactamase class C family)